MWHCLGYVNSNTGTQVLFHEDLSTVESSTSTGESLGILLTDTFIVGSSTGSSFNGFVRNIKIYNKYLTLGQSASVLRNEYVNLPEYGLIQHYAFNEPMGDFIKE